MTMTGNHCHWAKLCEFVEDLHPTAGVADRQDHEHALGVNDITRENYSLLRQPHDDVAWGMRLSEVQQLYNSFTQFEFAFAVHQFTRVGERRACCLFLEQCFIGGDL